MDIRTTLVVWLATTFLLPTAADAADVCPDPAAAEYLFGRMIELPALCSAPTTSR